MTSGNAADTSASNMHISSPENSLSGEARFANGHKKIFDEILRKRHFFRSLAGDSADPIIVTDTAQKIIFWNAGAEALCGYSEDEALGRHFDLVLPEEKREEVSRRVEEILQKGLTFSFETIYTAKNGARIPVNVSLSPVKDREGNAIGVCGALKDLTERKRCEEERKAHHQHLQTITHLTQMISESLDLDEVLDFVVHSAAKLLGVPFTRIFIQEGGVLKKRAKYGGNITIQELKKLDIGEGLSGWIAETGEPFYAEDVKLDPRWIFSEETLREKITSYLGVPLKRGGEVLGVLSIFTREVRHFTADEMELITSFANSAALAIGRARLREEENAAISF